MGLEKFMDAGSCNLSHRPARLSDKGTVMSHLRVSLRSHSHHLTSTQNKHLTPRLRDAKDLPMVIMAAEADLSQGRLPIIRSESRVVFSSSILQIRQLKPKVAG